MEFEYGTPVTLAPGVRRITCNNPSPLTGPGTNTYLVGAGPIAVIDPGPADAAHLQAISAAAPDISHILVTHSHLDHSPGARPLAEATGAPICGFGPSGAGTSAAMAALPDLGGGEGTDPHFAPDRVLANGAAIQLSDRVLIAHHTPGHFGNHMTFEADGLCFSGDLVMGWATTLISPPDGDLTDFMASCRALLARAPDLLLPGHGAPVPDPSGRIQWLIEHRLQRERQILDVLQLGPATLDDITTLVYTDVAPHLLPAAQRNVLAHLVDLIGQSRASCAPNLTPEALFSAL